MRNFIELIQINFHTMVFRGLIIKQRKLMYYV
jgi:hypothetical protein